MKDSSNIRPSYGALGLFLFLLGISLLFFRGQLESSDEILMASTSATLVEDFSLTFPQPLYGKTSSEYGLGTPLVAIPFYLTERILRKTPILSTEDLSLTPLANSVLFALIGVLAAGFLTGQKRWGAIALVVSASPLLPLSLTLYSELLASTALIGLVLALDESIENPNSKTAYCYLGAFIACAIGILARMSLLPLLLIVLLWGWKKGAGTTALLSALGGILLGGVITGFQNWILRGNPFTSGYLGQDFVSPILTGLYGLILSPERGILIFWPVILVPIIGWSLLGDRGRSLLILALGCTVFSLVFHGRFWTWHGGWTIGPRFLLPCLVLFLAPIAEVFNGRHQLSKQKQILVVISVIWSGLMAYIYARHSPIAWWNRLWGFHRIENLWLFAPQMSLWQAWFEGVPIPFAQPSFGRSFEVSMLSVSLLLLCAGIYPVLQPFRDGAKGLSSETRKTAIRTDRIILAGGVYLLLLLLVHTLSGHRGWKVDEDTGKSRKTFLLVDGEEGTFEALLDFPLKGPVNLYIKANAKYRLEVNERVVAEQNESIPQHLNTAEVDLPVGLAGLRATVESKDGVTPPLFELYWTWGGGGVFMAPAGGEYVLPNIPSASERFFTRIWRRKFILSAGLLVLLLLYCGIPRRKRRGSLI